VGWGVRPGYALADKSPLEDGIGNEVEIAIVFGRTKKSPLGMLLH
jgi:hypothetical protein